VAVFDPNPDKGAIAEGLRIFRFNYTQSFSCYGKSWNATGSPLNSYANTDNDVLADITWEPGGAVMFRIAYRSWWDRHHMLTKLPDAMKCQPPRPKAQTNGTKRVLIEYTNRARYRGLLLEPVDYKKDLYGFVYAPKRNGRFVYNPFRNASAYHD